MKEPSASTVGASSPFTMTRAPDSVFPRISMMCPCCTNGCTSSAMEIGRASCSSSCLGAVGIPRRDFLPVPHDARSRLRLSPDLDDVPVLHERLHIQRDGDRKSVV